MGKDVKRLEEEKDAMRLRWEDSVRQTLATVLCESRQVEELRRARSDALEAERRQLGEEWQATLKRPSIVMPASCRPTSGYAPCATDSPEVCSTADTSLEDSSDADQLDSPPSFDAPMPLERALFEN